MKRTICLLLCLLLLVFIAGCGQDPNSETTSSETEFIRGSSEGYPVQGLYSWYRTVMQQDYDMFTANFGSVISRDQFDQLQNIYDGFSSSAYEICILETLEDGTQVLLKLRSTSIDWTEFTISGIEILP